MTTKPHLMPNGFSSEPSQVSVVRPGELAEMMKSSFPMQLIHVTSTPTKPEFLLPSALHLSIQDIDVCDESYVGEEEKKGLYLTKVSGNYSLKDFDTLRRVFGRLGIDPNVQCIVYEGGEKVDPDTSSKKSVSADPVLSARLCWCLSLLGVKHVSLLLGGFKLWSELQFPLERMEDSLVPKEVIFETTGEQLVNQADTEEIFQYVQSKSQQKQITTEETKIPNNNNEVPIMLVDVRSWKEFSGEAHDYPYFLPLGRIPHSTWLDWGPSTYYGGVLADAKTGILSQTDRLQNIWSEAEIPLRTNTRLIFYCGSGWRSSLAWFLARLAGHENCANYDGGFLEWSWLHGDSDNPNPIETTELDTVPREMKETRLLVNGFESEFESSSN